MTGRQVSNLRWRKEDAKNAWEKDALLAFVRFAKEKRFFTTEDVRFANPEIVASGDSRRWGHIATSAQKAGYIDVSGYHPVRSSNGSAKRLWRSLVFRGKNV